MPPERWRQLKEWFNDALEMDPARREAFIEEVSAPDPESGEQLHKLLENHFAAERFFDVPNDDPPAPSGQATRSFHDGELVCGRFTILRLLGSGGMGDVYEAFDEILGVAVALKTIRPTMMADERLVRRLRKEVQLAREVTHVNVCRIHDLFAHRSPGTASEPQPEVQFVSMEFLAGETLASRLRREGALPFQAAVPIILQIAQGLAAAHRAGVVHRDLKPANIMLVPAGPDMERVVITDFGLARHNIGMEESQVSVVFLAGTPAYMAPEQLEGAPGTFASDVYALGVIMYQIIVGSRSAGHSAPPSVEPGADPLADIDPAWKRVILRCLDRDPARRFHSAGQLVQELIPEQKAPAGKHGWTWWKAIAAVIFFMLAVLIAFSRYQEWIPKIARGSLVLLTDIQTPDPSLEGLTTVLRSQLEQSPQFLLMGDDLIQGVLRQMGRPRVSGHQKT